MTLFSIFWGKSAAAWSHTIIASVRKFLYMSVTANQQHYEQCGNPTLNETANLFQSQAKDFFCSWFFLTTSNSNKLH